MTKDMIAETCTALTTVVKQCSLAALENADQFPKAFAMARGITQLRQLITPELMKEIMPLMNTALGFQTDRNPNQIDYKTGKPHVPYGVEIVKECFIEATLRGLSPVGNEWNILAGRFYATKNGIGRKLKELVGFTDFKPYFQVPRMSGDKGAIVGASATWKMNGIPDKIEREFAIKVNSGMGSDAIIGKAERKLRAAVYEQITGSHLSDGEAGDDDAIQTTATPSKDVPLAEKLKSKQESRPDPLKDIPPEVLLRAKAQIGITDSRKLTAEETDNVFIAAQEMMIAESEGAANG